MLRMNPALLANIMDDQETVEAIDVLYDWLRHPMQSGIVASATKFMGAAATLVELGVWHDTNDGYNTPMLFPSFVRDNYDRYDRLIKAVNNRDYPAIRQAIIKILYNVEASRPVTNYLEQIDAITNMALLPGNVRAAFVRKSHLVVRTKAPVSLDMAIGEGGFDNFGRVRNEAPENWRGISLKTFDHINWCQRPGILVRGMPFMFVNGKPLLHVEIKSTADSGDAFVLNMRGDSVYDIFIDEGDVFKVVMVASRGDMPEITSVDSVVISQCIDDPSVMAVDFLSSSAPDSIVSLLLSKK